jgi:hypothetical protein
MIHIMEYYVMLERKREIFMYLTKKDMQGIVNKNGLLNNMHNIDFTY